jgi:hypothetical protein
VFDELSYRQGYERRFPALQLPAFDALAAQATVFTHTIPAGIMTEKVLPSLLTGEWDTSTIVVMGGPLLANEDVLEGFGGLDERGADSQ